MKKYAVIVAGGKGLRMGTDIPKQYLPIQGLPILMRTINAFCNADPVISIVLVIPEHDFDYWQRLCTEYNFTTQHTLVKGGQTRFQSVRNGLEQVSKNSLVAIHDGVRPLVGPEIILKTYLQAEVNGNAVAAVPLKDSIREINGANNAARDRTKFYAIQTPQTFQSSIIKEAFNVGELATFTDDASVAEFAGHKINLVDGSYANIKITTQEDLVIAEALLKQKSR